MTIFYIDMTYEDCGEVHSIKCKPTELQTEDDFRQLGYYRFY